MRKKHIWIFICFFVFLMSLLINSSFSNEEKINKYMMKKYNVEIKMVYEEKFSSANMGQRTHTVALKNNEKIQFPVRMEGLIFRGVINDEYQLSLETHKQYKKIEKFFPTINRLGFEYKKFDYLYHEKSGNTEYHLYLTKEDEFPNDLSTEQLDSIYKIVDLIRRSGAPIDYLHIEDGKSTVTIDEILDIYSAEELYYQRSYY